MTERSSVNAASLMSMYKPFLLIPSGFFNFFYFCKFFYYLYFNHAEVNWVLFLIIATVI